MVADMGAAAAATIRTILISDSCGIGIAASVPQPGFLVAGTMPRD